MRRLNVDHRDYVAQANTLADLIAHVDSVDAGYRKLISEIALLRLFGLLERTVASIASKLCCGTHYCDGTAPTVTYASQTVASALVNMRTYKRSRPIQFLKWTQGRDIKKNVKFLIAATDPFVQAVDAHSLVINEMRQVRNHIAHGNTGTRAEYKAVVQQYYGAYVNSITPGALLLTPKMSPCLFEQYVIKSKILVRELTRA